MIFRKLAHVALYLSSPITALSCGSDEVIKRDVAILGGGASGTYAAIKLRDLGRTVAVIERDELLGGHTDTYIDPSGKAVDHGVTQYINITAVRDFLERLNVPDTTDPSPRGGRSVLFDMEHGKQVPNEKFSTILNTTSVNSMLDRLNAPYLEEGYDLPDPVPDDLALPFGDFVARYGYDELVYPLRMGYGDILSLPTIYVVKTLGITVKKELESGMIWTDPQNNQKIYDSALEILNKDVYLSAEASYIQRDDSGVETCVKTPTGYQLLHTKRLLVTAPPLPSNLQSLDMTAPEKTLFEQFRYVGYYAVLIRVPGLPENITFCQNVDVEAAFGMPPLPSPYRIWGTRVPELYIVDYGAAQGVPDATVFDGVLDFASSVRNAFGDQNAQEPEVVRYSNHAPYMLHVSPNAIRSGFYRSLNSLQGQHNTYWTGAAFHAQDSSFLWEFTGKLVDRMVGDMDTAE